VVAKIVGFIILWGVYKSTGFMMKLKDSAKKKAICSRLARVEGQLRGIQRQIDEEQDCQLIAQQLSAARKALDKTFFTMVACAIEQGDLPADHVADMLAKFA
jgi:CsoR family transcriptional regulator, copper-sensing transcriptional repressor